MCEMKKQKIKEEKTIRRRLIVHCRQNGRIVIRFDKSSYFTKKVKFPVTIIKEPNPRIYLLVL